MLSSKCAILRVKRNPHYYVELFQSHFIGCRTYCPCAPVGQTPAAAKNPDQEPLTPGEPVELDIEIWPMSSSCRRVIGLRSICAAMTRWMAAISRCRARPIR